MQLLEDLTIETNQGSPHLDSQAEGTSPNTAVEHAGRDRFTDFRLLAYVCNAVDQPGNPIYHFEFGELLYPLCVFATHHFGIVGNHRAETLLRSCPCVNLYLM
jgi:hypothetical protein